MKIKLDKDIECLINQTYQIDTSIFEEIERRRQQANSVISATTEIIAQSPQPIPEPEITDSEFKNIENTIRYEYRLKERELEAIKSSLSTLDVSIDKIDELVIQIDKKTNSLIQEINNEILNVESAYNDRILAGCRNNLKWEFIGTSFGYDPITNLQTSFSNYTVIKDSELQEQENYYGIKYYQKPSNRDYGFNIIKQFDGSIQINSKILAITSGSISNINVGDEITDSLNGVSSLYLTELPKVVGFGTTNAIGIQTTIYGSISTGSSVIAVTGIGSTSNISNGNFVLNTQAFSDNTKVIGFGTTVVSISYESGGPPINVSVPSILIDKVATSTITTQPIGFGSFTTVPSIELNNASLSTIENKKFTVIRKFEDSTLDFDFTKSPLDPVTIGIIDNNTLGVGNKIELVNNGEDEGPFTWREVLQEDEPECGNNFAIYYEGNTEWPYSVTSGYVVEGEVYAFNPSTPPSTTTISPTGISTTGSVCNNLTTEINAAKDKLEVVRSSNLPEISKLVAYSSVFRNIRNKYELEAWSYLQAISYLNSELSELNSKLSAIDEIDENIFNE